MYGGRSKHDVYGSYFLRVGSTTRFNPKVRQASRLHREINSKRNSNSPFQNITRVIQEWDVELWGLHKDDLASGVGHW